jgi:hypothetical protein
MATLTAQNLIDRVNDTLQDSTNVRWPTAELLRYLNDGQREIVLLRPDASVATDAVQLTANETKQSLPAAGIRLLDVIRNMGSTGSAPGISVRLISREVLDAQLPTWHSDPGQATVKHFMFDSRNPKVYYVYPRVHATTPVYVELVYSSSPADVAAANNTITLDDIYANALIDFMLYRAYSKDAEYAANSGYAQQHYQSFLTSLGLKGQTDQQVNPNQRLGGDHTGVSPA